MTKKFSLNFATAVILSAALSGCGGSETTNTSASNNTPQQTLQNQVGTLEIVINNKLVTPKVKDLSFNKGLSKSPIKLKSLQKYQRSNTRITENTARTSLDLIATAYTVKGVGPDGDEFEQILPASGSASLDFLKIGDWSITIQAKNIDDVIFAEKTETVVINLGQTTQTEFALKLLEGDGTIDLTINWPKIRVENPLIIGYLQSDKNASGEVQKYPLTFITDDTGTNISDYQVTVSDSLPAGYYTLVITVYDQGLSGLENHLALGIAETIRIFANYTVSQNYSLDGVSGTGSIGFDISIDVNDRLPISINNSESLPTSFLFNSSTVFTPTASIPSSDEDASAYTEVWYLNGEVVAIGNNFEINSDQTPFTSSINGKYLPGKYRLDVVAFNADASRSGSSSFEFEVTGDPVGIQESATVQAQVGFIDINGDDSQFSALTSATVTLAGQSITPETNGSVTFTNIAAGSHVLSITADGYFDYNRRVEVSIDQVLDLTDIVLTPGELSSFSATEESVQAIGVDLASITFSANSIVNADGTPYSGVVTIKQAAMNPLNNNFIASFPGEFKGINAGQDANDHNNFVDIVSFGVIAATLTDTNGNPLKIKNGQTAQLRIKAADPTTSPTTMPLWHLNPATGSWTKEGEATLGSDGYYTGQVTHFSWWNFDKVVNGERAAYRYFRVTVKDAAGFIIPNATITLTSRAGFAYEKQYTTDVNGKISALALFTESATKKPDSLFYDIEATYNDLTSGVQSLRFYPDSWGPAVGDDTDTVGDFTLQLRGKVPTLAVKALLTKEVRNIVHNGPRVIFTDNLPTIKFTIDNAGNGDLTIDSINIAPSDKYRLPNALIDKLPLTMTEKQTTSFNIRYLGDFTALDRATITFNSNGFTPKMDVGLAAIEQLEGLYEESIEVNVSDNFTGTIAKGQNVDPYSDNNTLVDNNPSIFYLIEKDGDNYDQRRGYIGFNLATLPKNIKILSATLTSSQGPVADIVNIFIGEHSESIVDTDFKQPCADNSLTCAIGSFAIDTGWSSNKAGNFNEQGLKHLQSLNDNHDQFIKLQLISTGTSYSYFYKEQLKLAITYAQ